MSDEVQPAEPREDATLDAGETIDEQAIWDKIIAEQEGRASDEKSDEPAARQDDPEPEPEQSPEDDSTTQQEPAETLETLRAERDQLRHYRQSNEGRVAALSRKISAYEAKIAELSKPKPGKPEDDGMAAVLAETAKVKEDYPDVIAPFEKLVTTLQEKEKLSQAERQREAQLRQQAEMRARQTALQQEESRLRQAMPQYDDFLKNHGKDFAQWAMNDAPVAIHNMVMENANAIQNADRALHAVKAYMQARGIGQARQDEPRQPAINSGQSRRERQLAAGASPSDGRRPSLANDAADEDEQWNRVVAQVFKQ